MPRTTKSIHVPSLSILLGTLLAAGLAGPSASAAESLPGALLAQAQAPAQPPAGGPESGPPAARRGPPPEAVAACQGKAAGEACSFTNPRGEARSGTCFAPRRPAGDENAPAPLACRPHRPAGAPKPGNGASS